MLQVALCKRSELMTLSILGAATLVIWVYLLLAHGSFWCVGRHLGALAPRRSDARSVVAVVPARNEAAVIAEAVTTLLLQRLAGSIRVIVIDDASTDGTAAAARAAAASIGAAARLTVIDGAALPTGWSGKVWALSQGVAAATAMHPDYLLFTDADIHHEPDNVAALVAHAEAHEHDMVSYMVKLSVASFAEKCLIPAFVFFFFQLYPPAWVASARSKVAGAAGGCILVRPQALARGGGLVAIRSQIIDDCALARIVKAAGGSIWLGLTATACSNRGYGSFTEIGRMISRTAFNQLRHSYVLLAATLAGLCLTYVLPPLLLLSGQLWPSLCGGLAWILMASAYAPIIRFYGLPPLYSLGLPGIAVFYGAATAHSALQYALGRGGQWKGRSQDPRARH